MAYTTINKGSDYFNTLLWTGDNSTRNITELNFQPDLVWIKHRTFAFDHREFDSVRGAGKNLAPNNTNAESTVTDELTAFLSNGFTLGNSVTVNGTGYGSGNFVGWSWKGGGTGVSNTNGSITSTVSANTTSGFSIVSYTGTGATATVGHGLSQTPEMIIVKLRSGSGTDWTVWGSILGGTVGSEKMQLNNTGVRTTGLNSSWFNNTAPTSSVFTVGTQSDLNSSGSTYIGYCFHSVKGYSKFGRYTGNGDANGTFVYTGFKPAFVITRRIDTTENWAMFDNKRDGFNVNNRIILANEADAENPTNTYLDLLSNGFKSRSTSGAVNASGGSYIYMAFAENPFVGSDGTPTTAR